MHHEIRAVAIGGFWRGSVVLFEDNEAFAEIACIGFASTEEEALAQGRGLFAWLGECPGRCVRLMHKEEQLPAKYFFAPLTEELSF